MARSFENACEEPSVANRPSRSGDFRIDLDQGSSSLTIGATALDGSLVPIARTSISGFLFVNQAGTELTIADLEVFLDPMQFVDGLISVSLSRMRAFSLARTTASQISGTSTEFEVLPAHLKLGASADVDGVAGGLPSSTEREVSCISTPSMAPLPSTQLGLTVEATSCEPISKGG